ncbi:MAG TPA: hypothetical protein VMF35_05090 [Acidimicrobiales bacterium]|nr:hypothetical protein [Acidimicrobiales bacterium]
MGAGPVTAAFFNFHPAMVVRAVPACWEVVAPETLCRVRAIAASDALNELCTTRARSALVAALPLLRRAVEDAGGDGRILAGANRALWPRIAPALGTGGVGEAWQAVTTLREHRGDGHVSALVSHGLRGVDAHLLAAGTKGIPSDILRDNRGFSGEEWATATAELAARGLVHPDGRATDRGRTLHAEVEALTDRLAEPAFAALSDAAVADLYDALLGCAAEVAASGLLPYPNPMGLPPAPAAGRRTG